MTDYYHLNFQKKASQEKIYIVFSDYFSRHPTSNEIPTSKDDENFLIYLIVSFKFLLKKADKISSSRNAESNLEQNDVINAKKTKTNKATRF